MNILFVAHNFVGIGKQHGGTELHIRDIVEQFQSLEEYHVWVLCPKVGIGIHAYYVIDTKTGLREEFTISYPVTRECYQHDDFNRKVIEVLGRHRIELVHFFHLMHFPLNFPIIAKQAGAGVVIAFHDYYLICRRYNLLTDDDSRFCGYPNVSLSTCDLCLRRSHGYAPGTQQNRRQLISEILYLADAVHYVSRDARERIVHEYPHLESKTEIVMGVGLKGKNRAATVTEERGFLSQDSLQRQTLRIACIGNMSRHKGMDLILSVIEHYRIANIGAKQAGQNAQVHFDLFGAPQPPYDDSMGVFADAEAVTVHGRYQPEDLPRLLADCDVALFASIWPETFVLALSEAWACNLVPIAPRLGAFGERITDHVTGRLFDIVNDPGTLIDVIDELVRSPESLIAMRQEIAKIVPLSLVENRDSYQQLYQRVAQSPSADAAPAIGTACLPQHPRNWHFAVSKARAVLLPPVPVRRTQLLRRVLAVLKQHGLLYTIWAMLNYKRLKRESEPNQIQHGSTS